MIDNEFNYSVWTPNTSVTLCNVPWNADYRDIVYFESHDTLDNYLSTTGPHTITIERLTVAKPNYPIRISLPFSDVYKYNYIAVRNGADPVGNKVVRFYYFITDVRYVAPNTTEILVQLDVWQTFFPDVQFGSAYVERGHIGIANSSHFDENGRTYLTVPEGLDVGGEYVIEKAYSRKLANMVDHSIMVVSTTDLDVAPNESENPVVKTATGCTINGLVSGCNVYVFKNPRNFTNYLSNMRNQPWVTRGIISAMAIPPVEEMQTFRYQVRASQHHQHMTIWEDVAIGPNVVKVAPTWRHEIVESIPREYRHLRKFYTYPYLIVEVTSYTGKNLILKPESMSGGDFYLIEMLSLVPGSERISWVPFAYNAKDRYDFNGNLERLKSGQYRIYESTSPLDDDDYDAYMNSEMLSMQTGIFNFPQFGVVNDGYMGYMAANKNTIAYQHSSADWSQQRALAGNELAYNQASAGIGLQNDLTGQTIGAANQQMALNNETAVLGGLQSGLNSVASGLGSGAAGITGVGLGIANAAASTAINIHQNTQSTSISNSLAARSNASRVGMSEYVRDSNKGYADMAAKGDYQNAIAGINAKVQDARMIQPTVSGQVGGEGFNLSTIGWRCDVKMKFISKGIVKIIGDYWLRYGYAVNRFVQKLPTDLMVMQRFTYWKLSETYLISGNCPETFKQTLRGIFEKGVTVWRNADDIGRVAITDNNLIERDYFGGS